MGRKERATVKGQYFSRLGGIEIPRHQITYVFRGCTPPFHFSVYVSGHFANIVTRGSAPPEHVPNYLPRPEDVK
jgi:hypothetical protein